MSPLATITWRIKSSPTSGMRAVSHTSVPTPGAIRAYKARALHFQLDLRRPEVLRAEASGAPGHRQTLPETVQEFLEHRPLDADLDRAEFVRLGVEYVAHVGREGDEGGGT